jgi:hypothetical protein
MTLFFLAIEWAKGGRLWDRLCALKILLILMPLSVVDTTTFEDPVSRLACWVEPAHSWPRFIKSVGGKSGVMILTGTVEERGDDPYRSC